MSWVAAVALLGSPIAHAGHPLGTPLPEGVLIDVTADGLGTLEGLATDFIPADFPIGTIQELDETCLFGLCVTLYEIYTDDLLAEINVDDLSLVPDNGELTLDAAVTVNVNSAGAPGHIEYFLLVAGETCEVWVDPITVDLSGTVEMSLVPDENGIDIDGDGIIDTKRFDVTVPAVTWTWDADGNDLVITDCLADDLIDVLDFFGLDIYQMILDLVEPQIDAVVQDLPAELEPVIEDATAGLVISEEVDLLGTVMDLSIWPDALTINDDGMRISLGTYIDVAPNACVAPYGVVESLQTPGAPPPMDHGVSPIPDPHMVASIDDDFANHLLFAAWSSGLLCFDLAEQDLGISIDTSLLGILAPDTYDHLFPTAAPMTLVTRPEQPPMLDMAGVNDVNVVVSPLGLEFAGEIDGRQVRLLNIDLDADIGLDMDYEPSTGELAIGIVADAGAIIPTVTYNELVPEATGQIETQFSILFDALLGPLLAGIGTDLAFPIPAIEGLGLTGLTVVPAGADRDYLGGYATAGPVVFPATGCDEEGGCDTSGCEGGCATGGLPARLALGGFALLVAMRRRR